MLSMNHESILMSYANKVILSIEIIVHLERISSLVVVQWDFSVEQLSSSTTLAGMILIVVKYLPVQLGNFGSKNIFLLCDKLCSLDSQ